MARYDFEALTPYDFELVVRDLLQEQLGGRLETFTPGPDSGIDIRYLGRRGKTELVIQCKKYHENAWSNLRAAVEKELPKIAKLKPKRYILATTVEMTPDRKDDLYELLTPWMKSPSDVYGRDDINNLLREYPAIEGRHFKLWLASTEVLQRVINSEIYRRSERFREAISFDMRVYVETAALPRARKMLEDRHVCIITGGPGIGKTTLANILSLQFVIDERWEVFKLSQSLDEADKVWRPDTPQLFLFDDFLGRIALSSLNMGRNEDVVLFDLIEAISRSPNKRLILTTRSYILQGAALMFERLGSEKLRLYEYVLRPDGYTDFDRARILYNHLSMSSLNEDAKLALLDGRQYRKVLRHPNYSPRLVYYMTTSRQALAVKSDRFTDFVFRVLDDPAELWRHIVENELDHRARAVLLVLASMPDELDLDSLETAVDSYMERSRLNSSLTFNQALKVLEGTFISIGRKDAFRVVSFRDPSILDFLAGWLGTNTTEVKAILRSATHFEQPMTLWDTTGAGVYRNKRQIRIPFKLPEELLIESLNHTFDSLPCTFSQRYISDGRTLRYRYARDILLRTRRLYQLIEIHNSIDSPESEALTLQLLAKLDDDLEEVFGKEGGFSVLTLVRLANMSHGSIRSKLLALGTGLKRLLLANLKSLDSFELMLDLRKAAPTLVTDADVIALSEPFRLGLGHWVDQAQSFDEAEALSEMRTTIESCGDALEVEVDDVLEELDYLINQLPDERDSDDDYEGQGGGGGAGGAVDSGGDIDSLFDSLRG